MFWQADALDDGLVISFVCLFQILSPYCGWFASEYPAKAEVGFDILLPLLKHADCCLIINTYCAVHSISTG